MMALITAGPRQEVLHFLHTLTTASVWVAVAGLIALILLLAAKPHLKWWLISALLYVCSLGFSRPDQPWFQSQLIGPLNVLRLHGRALSMALLIALLIPTFQSNRGRRAHLLLGATAMFFVFQLIYSIRLGMGGLELRSIMGGAIYLVIFIVFGFGLSRWLQDWDDTHVAIRCVATTGLIFAVCTIAQLAIHPSGIIWQHRLTPLGTQATQSATFIASVLLPVCAMVVHPRSSKAQRIFWGAVAGVLIVFLAWTGSRVGILMGVIGLGLLFRKRLLQFAGTALLVVIFAFIAVSIYQNSTIVAGRLISTQNTRASAWKPAWDQFLANPLTGVVDLNERLTIENAYLNVAARSGLVGLIPMGIMLALLARSLWRLQRLRGFHGERDLMIDLTTAGICSIMAGTVVEGYLLGTLVAPVFVLYVYLAMIAFLFDVADPTNEDGALPDCAVVFADPC